ncbi:MAG TPA: hypothetical protein VGN82_23215 [Bosea sp. (in: a-proteobacteria)]|jgi:hypothetical protein|uniref:hypothetical protein n=1 Tax=Bosea sp. (in: a-proteobacteria) TaxID=1871050 RepID=UPI002E0F8949|nr:hypothetical protein [Bosea sp. (in: a-proteobacteria)]
MTMLVGPAQSRELRRARAVYRTMRTTRSSTTNDADSLLAELAMLAGFLAIVAGVLALRVWLHVPGL